MRSPVELIRLAEGYARYLSEPTAEPYLAWRRIGQILRALPPTQAFDLTVHVIRVLPSSDVPSFGGGTLAQLIHHHGATLIDRIEVQAWRDVNFLDALSHAWIDREDLNPEGLTRLRLATSARIQIVTRSERDAAYRAMFERWMTRRQYRSAPSRKRPSRSKPYAVESIIGHFPVSARERASSPATMGAATAHKIMRWLRWAGPFLQLQVGLLRRTRVVHHMVQGALVVWFYWITATAISARLVLPTLVLVLLITSISPAADLAVVAGAFVAATMVAALAGVATGVMTQLRRQAPAAMIPYFGAISLAPFVTIIALIARTEHGVIVAPAVVVGMAFHPFIAGFLQRQMPATGTSVPSRASRSSK